MGEKPIPWIQVDSGLTDHPKVRELKRKAALTTLEAVGAAVLLWTHVAKFSPSGVIDLVDGYEPGSIFDCDDEVAARIIEVMRGGSRRMLDPIEGAEGKYAVHDWEQYAGQVFRKREVRRLEAEAAEDAEDEAVEREPVERKARGNDQREFRGHLLGEPSRWTKCPRHPIQRGYEQIPSPVPDLDIGDRWVVGASEPFAHRQYFRSKRKPEVLLVGWVTYAHVDSVERRGTLKERLEEAGWQPWGAVCPRLGDSVGIASRMLREGLGGGGAGLGEDADWTPGEACGVGEEEAA